MLILVEYMWSAQIERMSLIIPIWKVQPRSPVKPTTKTRKGSAMVA
ncbi:MAG: hypothetical protein P4M11_06915 [Candidatus Pacebacteria bacterium]|nr:hypothetical protein [Candidatus Paceibacterota bacterium]